MKKTKVILIIVGLLLILVPFLINIYNIFRLVSLLIGIIVLLIGLIIGKRKLILKVSVYPLVIIGAVFLGELVSVIFFKMVPIIAFAHASSSEVKTYNSLLYRVYDCGGVLTVDYNYEKDFLCNPSLIEEISINKLLENPKESFNKYKGKFVHIKGKINTIIGESSIALNAYDEKIELNGYVTFDFEKRVIIENLVINPSEYYVFDFVSVVGLVNSYEEKDGITTIKLTDAQMLKSDVYETYELLVNNIKDYSKVKTDDKLYYLGIEGIYYKYDENNIYEIDYLLLDKRETLENLINGINAVDLEDNNMLYELDNYNIIVCSNDDIIFANKDITNLKDVCENKEN